MRDLVKLVWRATKAADPTRPVIDASGFCHVETDIFDVHDYEQNPDELRRHYESLPVDGTFIDKFSNRQEYKKGQPVFVSEYGGMTLNTEEHTWGYSVMNDVEQFYKTYQGLTDALLDNPCICGFCYTQLTDVEQERNGVYYYDRRPKLDPERIRAINSRKAAIED